jgi:hypothetical protein
MKLTLFKPQWVLDMEQSILELDQYIATIKERDRQFYAGELPLPNQGSNSDIGTIITTTITTTNTNTGTNTSTNTSIGGCEVAGEARYEQVGNIPESGPVPAHSQGHNQDHNQGQGQVRGSENSPETS